MSLLSYIIWSPAPNIIPDLQIPRWYGLLFAMGFIVSQQIMYFIYRKEGKQEKEIDVLTVHMILGTVLGARLGHCLFYDPIHYLKNPLEILMIWEGGLASHGGAIGILIAVFIFVNYEVKVSYIPIIKGFIGIPKSIKTKKKKREGQSFLWVVDRLVIVVAITGAMIRTGNFLNSEIIGKPTDSEFGVVFARSLEDLILRDNNVDHVEFEKAVNSPKQGNNVAMNVKVHYKRNAKLTEIGVKTKLVKDLYQIYSYREASKHFSLPKQRSQLSVNVYKDNLQFVANAGIYGIARHPAQLYEAMYCIVLFIGLFLAWLKYRESLPEGLLFGIFLALLWALRFADEFFKENQVGFEDKLPINMGQILSIPLFLVGVAVVVYSLVRNKKAVE